MELLQEQSGYRCKVGNYSSRDREEHQGICQGQCIWHLEAFRPAGHQCQPVPVWQSSDRPLEGNRRECHCAFQPRGASAGTLHPLYWQSASWRLALEVLGLRNFCWDWHSSSLGLAVFIPGTGIFHPGVCHSASIGLAVHSLVPACRTRDNWHTLSWNSLNGSALMQAAVALWIIHPKLGTSAGEGGGMQGGLHPLTVTKTCQPHKCLACVQTSKRIAKTINILSSPGQRCAQQGLPSCMQSDCTMRRRLQTMSPSRHAQVCAVQARIADSKFSLSADSEQQVVKLGTSTDMGFCRSRKKVSTPPGLPYQCCCFCAQD